MSNYKLQLNVMHKSISTGNNYVSVMFDFRVKNNTICGIVPETCAALYRVLKDEYFKVNKIIAFLITINHTILL